MENLNLFVVVLAIVFQIEFIVGNEKTAYHVTDRIKNSTNDDDPCKLYENRLQCDFTTPSAKIYERVDLVTGMSINLTIEGAPEIQFSQRLCCFNEIQLFNSKYISANSGIKRSNSYRLWLKNSEATLIKDIDINYVKAENSIINGMYLETVGEFDINESIIGTFNANANEGMRSTLIGSTVKSLSLTIAEPSWLDIIDSNITSIEKIIFKNTQLSQVVNTTINDIRSKSVVIEKDSLVTLKGVELRTLASESIVVFGTLKLINIKHSKKYPLDWMVVMPGGSLTISKFSKGNNNTLQSYTIMNVDFELRPFEIIDVPKVFWLQITLSVFLGVALLIICLLLLWIFKFSGKQLPTMSIHVKKKRDEQKFNIIEKEADPVRNVSKNLYVTGDQEFPRQLNEDHHSDPESQQDYCEPDPNDLVNYTEPDGNVINKEEGSQSNKVNMDEKDPNTEKTKMPIRPPKTTVSLPSQKFIKPKPNVPNKSFLKNINSKLIQAPPPPSRTVSSVNGNFQKAPMKLPTLPPIRKMSIDVDEKHSESQEEYDELEDSDG